MEPQKKKFVISLKKNRTINSPPTQPSSSPLSLTSNITTLNSNETSTVIPIAAKKTKYNMCHHVNCDTYASFGYEGSRPSYCTTHKLEGMVNVKNRCLAEGCYASPNFGHKGTHKPLYCSKHKTVEMVNVVHKMCQFEGCETLPSFCYQGTKTPIFCTKHKKDNMINVKNVPCQHENCRKKAYFGFQGSSIAQYCSQHKVDGMTDIRHPVCHMTGCSTRPSFGHSGTNRAIFCIKHKEDGMVNVNNKKCKEPGCNLKPHFGYIGTKETLYCSEHKKPEMVDIAHKKCQYDGCKNAPSYGVIDTKTPIYCSVHAKPNMIDLKHARCQVTDCPTYASYGISGNQPTHCSEHKQIGQLLNPTRRCLDLKCRERALYGLTTPMYCEKHKSPDDIDLVQKACVACGLPDILDQSGKCRTCDPEMYRKVRLAKQKKVRDFFDFNQMKYISYDIMVEHGVCGKERPDFIFDCGTHIIVIEVDEDQHDGYPCSCEQIRMVNIGQSIGMKTVFIRYNPDKYKPFTSHLEDKTQNRLNALKKQIEYWSDHPLPSDGYFFVTYLYSDGDDPRNWKNLVKLM